MVSAMDRTETEVGPPLPPAPDRDQIVVLHGIPWAQYAALCRAREDSAGPRMAYLDGQLEIMSPGGKHEYEKKLIARLVETFGEEMGISLNGFGSTTFRRKAEEAGLEPDECYYVGTIKKVPDFAIEVAHTSGGVDKLEVYRRLRIPEVWFWVKGRFHIFGLSGRRYTLRERSAQLPTLDLAELAAIIVRSDESRQTETIRAYRRALRRRRPRR